MTGQGAPDRGDTYWIFDGGGMLIRRAFEPRGLVTYAWRECGEREWVEAPEVRQYIGWTEDMVTRISKRYADAWVAERKPTSSDGNTLKSVGEIGAPRYATDDGEWEAVPEQAAGPLLESERGTTTDPGTVVWQVTYTPSDGYFVASTRREAEERIGRFRAGEDDISKLLVKPFRVPRPGRLPKGEADASLVIGGTCYHCKKSFSFFPRLVPNAKEFGSTLPDAEREPICEACVDLANTERIANGLDPIQFRPGCYFP